MEFNSDYDIRLKMLESLGGDVTKKYDSVYSIDLEILRLMENGGGGLTEEQVKSIIETYNYITMADVESKGYTTMSDVEAKGYTTMADVESKGYTTMAEVEAKGYTTMADVEGKNYTTMTDVEAKGYITSAALPKEWYGTQAEFDAISVKDENTTYFIYE